MQSEERCQKKLSTEHVLSANVSHEPEEYDMNANYNEKSDNIATILKCMCLQAEN